jgi:hypothetical protein
MVVHLRTEMSFYPHFCGLETVHKPFGVLMCVLLQPTEVVADGAPNL